MREFPDKLDLFLLTPDPDSINIDKLGDGGTITTNTCNAAQKVRRLLVEYINGTVNKLVNAAAIRVWNQDQEIRSVSKFTHCYLFPALQTILIP